MGETTPRPVTTTRPSRPDEDENIGVRRGLFAPAPLGPSGLTVEDIRLWSGLFAPVALGPSGLTVEDIRLWSGLFAPAALGPSGLTVADIRLWSGLFAPAALIGAPGRFAPGACRTCPPFYSAPSSLAALAKSLGATQ